MALYDVIAALKAQIETIPDIGSVHDYHRMGSSLADAATKYGWTDASGNKRIRGWSLSRRSTETKYTGAPAGYGEDVHTIEVRGLMGLNDAEATEKTFQQLIEAVRQKLRVSFQPTATSFISDAPRVERVEIRQFGEVLCHYAEIAVEVTEFVS